MWTVALRVRVMTLLLLLTVGHGTLSQRDLAELLRGAGITDVVDVRRFPASRSHPHVHRDALAQWLPAEGIVWWRVPAFRGYASHMRTPEFADGMTELLDQLTLGATTVMCSESVWWRCHRRLIADNATLAHGVAVRHLLHNGRVIEHPVAAGARLVPPRTIVYDLDESPDGGRD
jgi:uncharacterized protein (DUF488 family)